MNPDRLLKLARRVARKYSVPGLSFDDVRQEIAVALLEAARDGVAQESHLVMRARRHMDRLLSRRPPESRPLEYPESVPSREHSPDAEPLAEELLAKVLEVLTPQQAIIIELCYRHGMNDEDVAEAINTTPCTVRRAKSYARDRLTTLFTF